MTHGADESIFLGTDYEIENGIRFVKTVRMGELIVARVSTGPGGGSQGAAPLARILPVPPETALAALLGLAGAVLLVSLAGGERQPAWRRALAGQSAYLFLVMTTLAPASALAAAKGDVQTDGRIDAADALRLSRALRGELGLTPEEADAADLAPFAGGAVVGDGEADAGDLGLLLRALGGEDVDGDGLALAVEEALGLSPFAWDTDGNGTPDSHEDGDADGLGNLAEGLMGTSPTDPDSDGDGIVDGKDGEPLVAAGNQVHWIHADHLGGSAVVTGEGAPWCGACATACGARSARTSSWAGRRRPTRSTSSRASGTTR